MSYSFNAYLAVLGRLPWCPRALRTSHWPVRSRPIPPSPSNAHPRSSTSSKVCRRIWMSLLCGRCHPHDLAHWTTGSRPLRTDRAIVDWQRSDDGGASWREIARSFQNEANPLPFGTGSEWRPWSVRHGFIATAADQGALHSRARVLHAAVARPPRLPAHRARNPHQCAAAERAAGDRRAAALGADSHRRDG